MRKITKKELSEVTTSVKLSSQQLDILTDMYYEDTATIGEKIIQAIEQSEREKTY